MLQTLDGVIKGYLHLFGQGRGHTLQVHLLRILTARLDEKLMPLFIGEADDLILEARAVSGANTLDLAAVKRTAVDVIKDDLLGVLVRPADMADDLVLERSQSVL